MNRYKKLSLSVFIVLSSSLLVGALLQKSEASLSVIKAGVDDKGNPECVNKSQVYLFKKDQAENKIIFYYHNPSDPNASVVKSFPDEKSLDSYWEELLRKW